MIVESEVKKKCEISEILHTFGKYQVIQYLLITLSMMCTTMISINYVFVVGDIKYRCRVDECEAANSTEMLPHWWPNSSIDHCSMPVLKSGEKLCTNNSFTGDLVPCTNWIYEDDNSVIAEFNLGCQPWKSNLIGTVHGLGLLVSMVSMGWISDKIGRKPTFIFCIVAGCIGQTKTLATSYNMYIIIEFIEAVITGGNYAAAMILLLEITPKNYRPWSGPIYAITLQLGECLFVVISYLVPYWKTVIHIINAPCIFFIVYIFLINESPRWQIVNGKVQQARKTIQEIATANNINIDIKKLENIEDMDLKKEFDIDSHKEKDGFMQIIKSKEIMKRTLVTFTCRFTSRLVYNGMMLNSVWLPGDKHLNFLLTVLMSFPGEILSIYLMYKIGRKITLMAGYLLCGTMCIILALTPASYLWSKLLVYLIIKMIISLCFSGTVTYSMELFPTSVRGTLMGLGSFGGRIATMIAAISPALNSIMEGLPLLFFGCVTIVSSSFLLLTPETKNLPLFDTIEQLDRFDAGKKVKDINVATIEQNIETVITHI